MNTGNYIKINYCEVCGNKDLNPVLNLGLHPMCDDLVPVGNSYVCKEYPIDIVYCRQCNTAHQQYQVPKKELFPKTYHYRSRFTADVLNGMKTLVQTCTDRFGNLEGKKVLDIGCNDGSLLDFFREKGASTFGIEPTGACDDAKAKGHVVYNDYLSEDVAQKLVVQYGQPDFITFTNVFAHIENLSEVFASLKSLLGPCTVLVIENHYLGAVLNGKQFDTFYHEHPRTYSFTSFSYMAKSLGLKINEVEFPSRYGGNIRVLMSPDSFTSKTTEEEQKKIIENENHFFESMLVMSKDVEKWINVKKEFINDHVAKHGKLIAKAFPGRAAILVKLLNLDQDQVEATFEKPGSLKVGHYLPGTRIPIKSDDDLFVDKYKNAPIINLAWHIPTEIRNYLKVNGHQGEVIDILNTTDFSN